MTTWVLIVFLTYSGNADTGGGVALTNFSRDFFLEKDCRQAAKDQTKAFNEAGFRRFTILCSRRMGPLLEPESAEEAKAK